MRVRTLLSLLVLILLAAPALADNPYTHLRKLANGEFPSIWEGQVAWSARPGGAVSYWDGKTTKTVPGYTGGIVRICEGDIAFAGWDGTDNEIYFFDGTSTTQVTSNSVEDWQLTFHDGEMAYVRGAHPNLDLYYWNGTTESLVHDGTVYWPSIYDGQIAYHQADDVYLWNGTTTTAIPDLGAGAAAFPWAMTPSLWDGEIAFQGYDGNDYEIYYWDGTSTIKITDNSVTDWNPHLHDGTITWSGWDGSDYEIWYWDGTTTYQITDDSIDDYAPRHYGNMLAFQKDVNLDGQIWIATPEPATWGLFLLGAALAGVAARRGRRRRRA